jgi:hypothetical protein
MRLRTRMHEELIARIAQALPDALPTVWGHSGGIVLVIEQLKFTSAGGNDKNGWAQLAKFTGVLRAELRADEIDAMEVEPLITNLVADPVFLARDEDGEIDALSETARAILAEWRDTVRDTQVVSALRFNVEGTMLRRVPNTPALGAPVINRGETI